VAAPPPDDRDGPHPPTSGASLALGAEARRHRRRVRRRGPLQCASV